MRFKILLTRCYQYLMTLSGRKKIQLSKSRRNAVVLLAPDYGNIGDLAIGLSQIEFLRDIGDFEVINVSISDTYRVLRSLRKQLHPNDVVLLVGGGNMGDLYPRAQRAREFIVNYLTHSRIVSFPQSIIYSGRPEREVSIRTEAKVLSAASNRLVLFAREAKSLAIMRDFFPGRVGYAPDIVLSLVSTFQRLPDPERSGVLLVLREDGERLLTDEDQAVITEVALAYGAVEFSDHGVPDAMVDHSQPHVLATAMLNKYRSSSLVVTDRLHGMIFAVITGTPCVVLPNSNHKITGSYRDWIQPECTYIRLVPDADRETLENAMKSVTSTSVGDNFRKVRFDFEELASAILHSPESGD